MKLLLIFLFISPLFAEEITFSVLYENKSQPPYYLGNTEEVLEKPGLAVEMVQLLEKKLPQIKVVLSRAPWKRCKKELELGKTDAIFNASFKKKRLKIGKYPWKNGKVDPSSRITTISYSLYKLKDNPISWNGKKFINLEGSIAAPLGYSIVGDLRKKNIEVNESRSTKTSFRMLQKNRVQGVAAQTVTGDDLLKSNKFKSIIKNDPPLVTKDYFLMISHQFYNKHPKLSEKIWKALAEIRQKQSKVLRKKYEN